MSQSERIYQEIARIARYEGLTIGQLLGLAVDRIAGSHTSTSPTPTDAGNDPHPIYALYRGVHTDALYDPRTGAVTITNGPLGDHRYNSPTAARAAVIGQMNPHVNPGGNGWIFWRLTATGQKLDSLRTWPRAIHQRRPTGLTTETTAADGAADADAEEPRPPSTT